MQTSARGFTLIELLVVIAIIGILSSVVLASLNGARKKGRDARRISDLKQIQLAMEMYADANQYKYPLALSSLAPTYISVVPSDPQGGSYTYAPFQTSSGTTACTGTSVCTTYVLAATLEDSANAALSQDIDGTVGSVSCGTGTPESPAAYCVRP